MLRQSAPTPQPTAPAPSATTPTIATRPRSPWLVAVALCIGLLGSGALVWQSTAAVFSSTTSNAANSWTAGSVSLSDDDAGSAQFAATGLVPGSNGSNCITVSYSGTVATAVELYVSTASDLDGLGQHLDLTIQEGTGGGFGSCAGFTASGTIFTGTLDDLITNHTDYASGVGTWTPSSSASRVYRIAYTLNAATPSNLQGADVTATFMWEAQA